MRLRFLRLVVVVSSSGLICAEQPKLHSFADWNLPPWVLMPATGILLALAGAAIAGGLSNLFYPAHDAGAAHMH